MSFSEQIQRCGDLSDEQALDLRAFIVEASGRLHAEPSVFSMRVQRLREELANQGFDLDNLVRIVQQVAKGSLDATKQTAFAADCESYITRNASIAEFASMLSADYSDLQKVLEQLVEAAQEDQRSLMAIAGGTSTWKATPNATKKQKSKKIGIDIAEVAAATLIVGSAVNFGFHRYVEYRGSKNIVNAMGGEFGFRREDSQMIGEIRYRKALGMIVTDRKFDRWFGIGGRINYELNRFVPGGLFRIGQQEAQFARNKMARNHNSDVSDEIESLESSISESGVSVRRIGHEMERSEAFDSFYNSLMRDPVPSVKTHINGRKAWSEALKDLPSLDNIEGRISSYSNRLVTNILGDIEASGADAVKGVAKAEENLFDIEL